VPETNKIQVGDAIVTVPEAWAEDPDNGLVQKPDGAVDLPAGSTVEMEDENGGKTTVALPSGGGSITVKDDGSVTLPAGSTVKPDKGYQVDKVTVTGQDGDAVKVKDNGNGTYTFTQPKGTVTVSATYKAVQGSQPAQPTQPVTPSAPPRRIRTSAPRRGTTTASTSAWRTR